MAIINFSGNVGKTTVAKQLLAPRMEGASEFVIETINANAQDDAGDAERLKGKEYGSLLDEIGNLDSAIVDVGASNVEQFIKLMGQFEGSHEEFDYYVVPVVDEKKQQVDAIGTIATLARLGVPPKKIRVVFNKVDLDDAGDIPGRFAALHAYHQKNKLFTLSSGAVIFISEVFERIGTLKKSIAELAADTTDYRAQRREAKDETGKNVANTMLSTQQLARSANRNLDAAYKALFA
ncbi:StbB family protein [Variovorax sp. YR216]|uniref:StbB family protein n=1 Tax=Variovorax sp. YR216 TaxID=1882828 RepID=UPI00210E8A49|nr:StbB family protein [Variovorax sp. YR216]